MDIIVDGGYEVDGVLEAPPSKSYTHRYLFLSLLGEGTFKFVNPLISGDTEATLSAIKKFGAFGSWNRITSSGRPKKPDEVINCGRSGTTYRVSLAIASLINGMTLIDGDIQLRRRPIEELIDALKGIGVEIYMDSYTSPIIVKGGIKGGDKISISASKSSQYVTALLYLSLKTGMAIEVIDRPVSKGYIDVTIKCMEDVGLKIYREGYNFFKVEPRNYRGREFVIPGDYSAASFLMIIGAIGGRIKIKGLKPNDPHPDKKIIEILKQAGAYVNTQNDVVTVERRYLEAFETDLRDSPDLLPTVSILAAFSKGKSRITGIRHTRYKESNRPLAISKNLREMGVEVKLYEDAILIRGRDPKPGVFNSFRDHRIAIAFTIASLFLKGRSIVKGVEVFKDSYPSFMEDLDRLGIEVIKK